MWEEVRSEVCVLQVQSIFGSGRHAESIPWKEYPHDHNFTSWLSNGCHGFVRMLCYTRNHNSSIVTHPPLDSFLQPRISVSIE